MTYPGQWETRNFTASSHVHINVQVQLAQVVQELKQLIDFSCTLPALQVYFARERLPIAAYLKHRIRTALEEPSWKLLPLQP